MIQQPTTITDGSALVADFITSTTWNRLPVAVQHKARQALLDTVGATIPGTQTPVSRIAAASAVDLWPGDQAAILLHGQRASVAGAAFANGCAANGIDIDDCGLYTKGHPGAQVFAAALAVAEALGSSGAEMLAAMVVGYEVAHRAARIWHAAHADYQACGSWGSVACAAIAAHLMGLDADQTQHALGIAEYHAPNLPMMRDIDHPAMVKHGIGWGALNGIVSAKLAANGYTGIPSLFGLAPYRDWVGDLGQHFIMVDGVIWKRYACCAWTHAALKGAEELKKAHRFRAEDIAAIRVEAFHEGVRLGRAIPTTTEAAQFNMAWPLAVFLIDGQVGPDQIMEHRFSDPQVCDLVSRIELVETDTLNELYCLAETGDPRGKYANVVKITLHDGRAFDSGLVEGDINYPQTCWDDGSLEGKFRWLAGSVLDASCVDALGDMLWHFDQVPSVRELTRLLT